MPKWKLKLPMTHLNITVLLFDAFSNMVLACLLEPLRVVRDQHGLDISWTILTETDLPVESSSGIAVTPYKPKAHAKPADLAFVIGGDVFRDTRSASDLRRSLDPLIANATVIAADTGTWILARCGYLEGRKATLHWQLLDEFAETFQQVDVSSDRVVRDGRFWTCGTAAAALDLMLDYIRERFGPAVALDAGAMFLHDNARRHGASYPARSLPFNASPKLARVLQIMSETLENPVSIAGLAEAANMPERSFHRLFLRELQMPPGKYYVLLRLARARELARYGGLTRGEIALRCGFANASTLARSFRQHHASAFV
ncbi:GlxA family transcriptional regulator [Planktotalea sp.]|uniref:GlxA family transcriptional regulator n=1 Tax=Planktotalea sp. TaxID=2029877 RepID=UPI0035C8370C